MLKPNIYSLWIANIVRRSVVAKITRYMQAYSLLCLVRSSQRFSLYLSLYSLYSSLLFISDCSRYSSTFTRRNVHPLHLPSSLAEFLLVIFSAVNVLPLSAPKAYSLSFELAESSLVTTFTRCSLLLSLVTCPSTFCLLFLVVYFYTFVALSSPRCPIKALKHAPKIPISLSLSHSLSQLALVVFTNELNRWMWPSSVIQFRTPCLLCPSPTVAVTRCVFTL